MRAPFFFICFETVFDKTFYQKMTIVSCYALQAHMLNVNYIAYLTNKGGVLKTEIKTTID
jgi:hypothetical protein